MSTVPAEPEVVLSLESAGLLMTPKEFDAVEEYDENYHYELVDGVLVVTPTPLAEETGPNELLGHLFLQYQERNLAGSALDYTLPQQYVRTRTSRRLADRLIWTGLGRMPNRQKDLPSIAVEFASAGHRNQKRDYIDKRREYLKAGIKEYRIIDRFQRTMTVIHNRRAGPKEQVIAETDNYESRHLPRFKVPLARLLAAADQLA
jgi:Uma2 family endonuclease